MTNSPLVTYTRLSQNHSGKRTHAIDTITIHCVVGHLSLESLGNVFAPASKKASSNYGIDDSGNVGMYVEEHNRSWASSNNANDQRAVTIEVASDNTHPYKVTDKALSGLIALCVDICKRNNIKKLLWKADKTLIGQVEKQNMTVHRWFANKVCPGEYLYNLHGKIAEEVNRKLGVQAEIKPNTPTTEKESAMDYSKAIWDFLKGKKLNDFAIAGIMGNLQAESNLNPKNLQNSFEKKLGMTDASYTSATDTGVYHNFVKDSAGYGLAQWTFWSRKQALLDFALKKKTSIGDLQMQLEFLWKELQDRAPMLKALKVSKSVKEASDIILTQFEKPADQSDKVKATRAKYGQSHYDKYSTGISETPTQDVFKPYIAKITATKLNIRKQASSASMDVGDVLKGTSYTIVEEQSGAGSKKGWGKLKSGAGWVSLDYMEFVRYV